MRAGNVGVDLLHLRAADHQLIIYLIDIHLYRLFCDLCIAAGIVERGFSCLQTDKYLAIEEYLREVEAAGSIPLGTESGCDKAEISGSNDRLTAAILHAFLGKYTIGGLGDEVGKALYGNIRIVGRTQRTVQLRIGRRCDIAVRLLLDLIIKERIFNLGIVLIGQGDGLSNR